MGLSNVMRERRRALGLSQKELSERSGVTPRQIARYEAGEQQPALNVAAAIAHALDISVADLAEEAGGSVDLNGPWTLTWGPNSPTGPTGSDSPNGPRASGPAPDRTVVDDVALIHTGTTVRLVADRRADQGRPWRAELRIGAGLTLVGWYLSDDDEATDRGALLLTVDHAAGRGRGRWLSTGADRQPTTGELTAVRGSR